MDHNLWLVQKSAWTALADLNFDDLVKVFCISQIGIQNVLYYYTTVTPITDVKSISTDIWLFIEYMQYTDFNFSDGSLTPDQRMVYISEWPTSKCMAKLTAFPNLRPFQMTLRCHWILVRRYLDPGDRYYAGSIIQKKLRNNFGQSLIPQSLYPSIS